MGYFYYVPNWPHPCVFFALSLSFSFHIAIRSPCPSIGSPSFEIAMSIKTINYLVQGKTGTKFFTQKKDIKNPSSMDISHLQWEFPIETSHFSWPFPMNSSPSKPRAEPQAAPLAVELKNLHASMGAWPTLILHLSFLTWTGTTMGPWILRSKYLEIGWPREVHCWNPGLFKNDMWSVKAPRGWPPKRDGNLGNLSAAKSGASAAKNAWLVRP